MPKKKNDLSSTNKLTSNQAGTSGLSRLLAPISLVNSGQNSSSGSGPSVTVGASNDFSAGKINGFSPNSAGINFGKPSSDVTTTTPKQSEWSNLLKQTASGGVASALGGSFGLGSIAGLGSVVSSLMSLFKSGPKTPAPLVEFSLPNSINQTSYVSSAGTTVYQGTANQATPTSSVSGGIYSSTKPVNTSAAPTAPVTQTNSVATSRTGVQLQSSQIAQAVKTALLNSSSLNDVIAEI